MSAYQASLTDNFRSFYDDMNEYGNPNSSRCIYFIHGLDGSPGQIRFALPAASRFFHTDMYVRGLLTPEFSCRNLIWEKYSPPNIEKKIKKIVAELTVLAKRYKSVLVFCSSNGFYDFYGAYSLLGDETKAALKLFWVACAPDRFEDTLWEKVFYAINGFTHNGYRWVALPNCNALRGLNPEVPYVHQSLAHKPHKNFYKHDMESRFYIFGALWSYFSIKGFNDCLDYAIGLGKEKIAIPTFVLAAEFDGYWQGKAIHDMHTIIEKYVVSPQVLVRPTSHLWIASPEHVYALLRMALGEPVLRQAA